MREHFSIQITISSGHNPLIVPSRRDLIASVAGIVSVTAGCLGNEESSARCASRGVGSESQHLRRISTIRGDEQVALGVLVSDQAVSEETYRAVQIRDATGELVTSIPLMDNRDMSRLEPEDYDIFTADSGALYAVPLGPPPVHGEFTARLIGADGEQLATARLRFNCYAKDGNLP